MSESIYQSVCCDQTHVIVLNEVTAAFLFNLASVTIDSFGQVLNMFLHVATGEIVDSYSANLQKRGLQLIAKDAGNFQLSAYPGFILKENYWR